jgi:NDP-sugar pyrophosphorylase family protein
MAEKIVLIVDRGDRLLGTVTDGDIRRALIQHHEMNTHLSIIMHKSPVFAYVEDGREVILEMMKDKSILQVPILDSDNKVVGLETLQHLFEVKKRDNPVFLMAGGFGTRLHPLTHDTPKPMLKVGRKPILEIILDQFIEAGFYNFIISTHYKAEVISGYFGDGSNWGVSIRYVYEEKPLGTAGALGLLPSDLPNLPILVMNGDLLTQLDFEQLLNFHVEQGGEVTVCVREYDFQVPYGVIEMEDQRITNIIEKPIHKFFVNAGIYVLNSSLVKSVDGRSYLDMPNLLKMQIKEKAQVTMFPIHEYWLDIGQIEQFEQAQKDCKNLF